MFDGGGVSVVMAWVMRAGVQVGGNDGDDCVGCHVVDGEIRWWG